MLTLSNCVEPLQGALHGADVQLESFSTDTRTLTSGNTFIALSGPNHDAHEHCETAQQLGANALIVERRVTTDLPQLVVDNTRLALGTLSRLWCGMHKIPVIAVTGSNGKTTVKEMIASILRQLGPVLATKGNLNNDIGVPLTLLNLRKEHRYAVIEMGANHVGEIAYLSELACPDVAVITNISSAHLEGFGSVDAIASAKSEIFQGVGTDGYAVINSDDKFVDRMTTAAKHCHAVLFGMSAGVEVRGGFINNVFTIKLRNRTIQPQLQLLGEHNRINAVAAAAAVSCLDIQPDTISLGLEQASPVPGRLHSRVSKAGALIIDDSYNANPASARAAIEVLAEQKGDRILILGDMRELGADEIALHTDVGNFARAAGINRLYAVGPLAAHAAHAFGESGMSFTDKKQLLQVLKKHHPRSTTFLVKGSRGSQMEDVVEGLVSMEGNGASREASLT